MDESIEELIGRLDKVIKDSERLLRDCRVALVELVELRVFVEEFKQMEQKNGEKENE